VLIVEDNERNLRLVRDVLEFSGFETVEARTGRDGIELASSRRPDVILIDLQLPDMDGLATLAGIRAQAPSAAIPAVALTAFAMKGDEERALAAGFDGYLTKPIDVRSFPEQIRRFCEGVDA
jgi:two-component system, cell cycle response regulator DivK